mmetsp:Transcript_12635/g.43884  ORF Transcript_12635/g.43884 Transcript_12635/m.43884 type:complete len:119 (-) Transcript_12635:688-1044(-)
MGCVCGKPLPPVNALVGTWSSDDRAASLRTGYGAYRVKRGYFPGLRSGGEERARITIKPSGWVSYVHVSEGNMCTLVDMPVSGWEDGTMRIAMGGSLRYTLGEDGVLVVDGLKLYKQD